MDDAHTEAPAGNGAGEQHHVVLAGNGAGEQHHVVLAGGSNAAPEAAWQPAADDGHPKIRQAETAQAEAKVLMAADSLRSAKDAAVGAGRESDGEARRTVHAAAAGQAEAADRIAEAGESLVAVWSGYVARSFHRGFDTLRVAANCRSPSDALCLQAALTQATVLDWLHISHAASRLLLARR